MITLQCSTDNKNVVYDEDGMPWIVEQNSILNLTQHCGTMEQKNSGVIEPDNKKLVQELLTFDTIPNKTILSENAEKLAQLAKNSGTKFAMIGGAPFFMAYLENELLKNGIVPLYAFSVRDCVEKLDKNGNIVKTNIFKHVGFVGID